MRSAQPAPDLLTQRGIQTLIARFVGQANVLTIPRVFIDLCGGNLEAALLLSQVLYWTERTRDPQGWFYKTADEWQDELSLSEYQIRKARKVLTPFGLETDLRAVHNVPILHYRLDPDRFSKSILQFLQNADSTDSKVHSAESAGSTIAEITPTDHPKRDVSISTFKAQIRRDRPDLDRTAVDQIVTDFKASGGSDWLEWWKERRDWY